jgi:hypothetical protein
MVMVRRLAESQAGFKGCRGGGAAFVAQAGQAEDLAGVHGRNAIEAAEIGEAQPVHFAASRRLAVWTGGGGLGVGHRAGIDARILLMSRRASICQVENVTMGH